MSSTSTSWTTQGNTKAGATSTSTDSFTTGTLVADTLQLSSNVIKASDGGSTITLNTSDNVTVLGDLTVTGGKITFGNGELISNEADDTLTFSSTALNQFLGANDCKVSIRAGDSTKDAGILLYPVNSVSAPTWSICHDGTDSNTLKFDAGNATVGAATKLSLTSAGNMTIAGDLTIAGSIYTSRILYHEGDTNTYLDFSTDRLSMIVGGHIVFDYYETDSDSTFFLDKLGKANTVIGDPTTFFVGGSEGSYDHKIGIGTVTPSSRLEVVGSFASNGPSSTFVTMSSGDTSPDISTGNIFKSHSDGVTIDQFDGGTCGQIITIISGGATVYDVTSSELKGGTTNITTAAGDVTMWICESATVWHLLSWMDLSIDLSSGGF